MIEILEGPDLSRHNLREGDVIDIAKFRLLPACIIKLTEGWSYLDPRAYYLIETCEKAEVPYMVYHYWHPAMNQDKQADWFSWNLAMCEEEFGRLPPMGGSADVETNNRLQREAVDRRLRYFLPAMEDRQPGVVETIYTRKTFFDPYVSTSVWYGELYHLWVAHYETLKPWIPAAWRKLYGDGAWDMHQLTNRREGYSIGVPDRTIDWNRIKSYMVPEAGLTLDEQVEALWKWALSQGMEE